MGTIKEFVEEIERKTVERIARHKNKEVTRLLEQYIQIPHYGHHLAPLNHVNMTPMKDIKDKDRGGGF